MPEPTIEVDFDEATNKVRIVLDENSYRTIEKKARAAGMTVEDFARKIITDGMRKEFNRGGQDRPV